MDGRIEMNTNLQLREHMEKSWLIQRLDPPRKFNPFPFGGGLANGGLSKDAMELLSNVFSFDYMGSSEFEWGAVPDALSFIVKQVSDGKIVVGEYRKVYYISPTSYESGVRDVINQLIKNERVMRLKEHCGLAAAMKGDKFARAVGWFEIDNGFFLFIDKVMFDNTKALFGIE